MYTFECRAMAKTRGAERADSGPFAPIRNFLSTKWVNPGTRDPGTVFSNNPGTKYDPGTKKLRRPSLLIAATKSGSSGLAERASMTPFGSCVYW